MTSICGNQQDSRPLMVQGEDVIRQSGVPFAVVRPTALTEEDAGAELQFDQGDTIKVATRLASLLLPTFCLL